MKWLDRELQRQRVTKVLAEVPDGARVLDVGCADGRLFCLAGGRISKGLGLDVDSSHPWLATGFERVIGKFPQAIASEGPFDVIAMLAVVEHLGEGELLEWSVSAFDLLRPRGRLLITMPSPFVDHILEVAIRLKLLDGMDATAHHGASPKSIEPTMLSSGFEMLTHRRFQLGLNNLFVFEKP